MRGGRVVRDSGRRRNPPTGASRGSGRQAAGETIMANYTHEFHEAGNGFPQDGDNVLCEWGGEVEILTVEESSPIHTAQWQANMIYVTCRPADECWDDLTEQEQAKRYQSDHWVKPITADVDAPTKE